MVTLLFIPGSAAPAAIFAPFQSYLARRFPSLKTQAVSLPSVAGPPNPPASLTADVNAVLAMVKEIRAKNPDEEIVFFGHAYGGIPISHALKTLGSRTSGNGKGIQKVILMSGLMLNVGTSSWDLAAAVGLPDHMELIVSLFSNTISWSSLLSLPCPLNTETNMLTHSLKDDYFHLHPPETAAKSFANQPPDMALKYANMLRYHSIPAFKEKVTHEGWNDVEEVHYFMCQNDTVVPMVGQRLIVNILRNSGANITDWLVEGADHAPHVEEARMPILGDYIEQICGL